MTWVKSDCPSYLLHWLILDFFFLFQWCTNLRRTPRRLKVLLSERLSESVFLPGRVAGSSYSPILLTPFLLVLLTCIHELRFEFSIDYLHPSLACLGQGLLFSCPNQELALFFFSVKGRTVHIFNVVGHMVSVPITSWKHEGSHISKM